MTVVPAREHDLNEAEARALTERIKAQTEHLWKLLLEAHERKAWKVLGYPTWRNYCRQEFGMSQSRAYQLLDQAEVVLALESASSTMVELSEREAREIKPLLAVVTEGIASRIELGEEPETAVRETVAVARSIVARERAGIVVTKGNAPDVAIQKAMDTLDVMRSMFRTVTVESLPDDAPAERWIREIDQTLKALRTMRTELRSKYGIS